MYHYGLFMTINTIKTAVNDLIASLQPHQDSSDLRTQITQAWVEQTIERLQVLLSEEAHLSEEARALSLESFLAECWSLVQGTALCYTALPNEPITLVLARVAEWVGETLGKPPLSCLMPGVMLENLRDEYPDLNNVTSIQPILNTHVYGVAKENDHTPYLLPVKLLTELSLLGPNPQFYHPYAEEYLYLTDDVMQRLFNHSTLTRALNDTYQTYHQVVSDDSNLLGQLTQLVKQLAINSVNGLGQETNAAGGAYPAIIAFMNYYTQLEPCGLLVSKSKKIP